MSNDEPGVDPVPPTELGADAPTDPKDQPVESKSPGSEAVTNPEDGKDRHVPYDRFREVNEAKKQAEGRAKELEAELEELKKPSVDPPSDDEIDPDTEKLLDSYARKKGFVSEIELQVRSDVQDLKTEYAKTDVPFDDKAIYDYSKKNGLPVPASKEGWRAMYKAINHEAILESERKKAIAEYRKGSDSTAEKPGPGGAKKPTEEKLLTRKERIHAAAQRVFGN